MSDKPIFDKDFPVRQRMYERLTQMEDDDRDSRFYSSSKITQTNMIWQRLNIMETMLRQLHDKLEIK